jgi:hypothetical protein
MSAGQPFLSTLDAGMTVYVAGPDFWLVPLNYGPQGDLVIGKTDAQATENVIERYEWNGTNQAKLSLKAAGGYWSPGHQLTDLAYPIALDPTAENEGFLVTDTGGGQLTFSTFHSPPGPYVGMQAAGGGNYLCYGLSDPGTDRFAIQIAHG